MNIPFKSKKAVYVGIALVSVIFMILAINSLFRATPGGGYAPSSAVGGRHSLPCRAVRVERLPSHELVGISVCNGDDLPAVLTAALGGDEPWTLCVPGNVAVGDTGFLLLRPPNESVVAAPRSQGCMAVAGPAAAAVEEDDPPVPPQPPQPPHQQKENEFMAPVTALDAIPHLPRDRFERAWAAYAQRYHKTLDAWAAWRKGGATGPAPTTGRFVRAPIVPWGMGNRLGPIISTVALAMLLDRIAVIDWPCETSWYTCPCDPTKLWETTDGVRWDAQPWRDAGVLDAIDALPAYEVPLFDIHPTPHLTSARLGSLGRQPIKEPVLRFKKAAKESDDGLFFAYHVSFMYNGLRERMLHLFGHPAFPGVVAPMAMLRPKLFTLIAPLQAVADRYWARMVPPSPPPPAAGGGPAPRNRVIMVHMRLHENRSPYGDGASKPDLAKRQAAWCVLQVFETHRVTENDTLTVLVGSDDWQVAVSSLMPVLKRSPFPTRVVVPTRDLPMMVGREPNHAWPRVWHDGEWEQLGPVSVNSSSNQLPDPRAHSDCECLSSLTFLVNGMAGRRPYIPVDDLVDPNALESTKPRDAPVLGCARIMRSDYASFPETVSGPWQG